MGKEDHGDALGEIQSVEKALGRRSQFLQQINGKRGVCVCVCVCVCEREREREALQSLFCTGLLKCTFIKQEEECLPRVMAT